MAEINASEKGYPMASGEHSVVNMPHAPLYHVRPVVGHAAVKLANPAPLTMLGLCISLTCISFDMMGWRGSGGRGAASTGVYIFIGGLLMVIAGVLEFFCGNTLGFVVSCGFGGHWFTIGATNIAGLGAFSAYSSDPTGNPYASLSDSTFLASFPWFFLCMAIFSTIALVCALNTNLPNIICFIFLVVQYCLVCASYWSRSAGHDALGETILVAAGASGFHFRVVFVCGTFTGGS